MASLYIYEDREIGKGLIESTIKVGERDIGGHCMQAPNIIEIERSEEAKEEHREEHISRLTRNTRKVNNVTSERKELLSKFGRCVSMGCSVSKKKNAKRPPGYEDPDLLASVTPFTVAEVEALYELFKKLSSSIIDDGLIHKEEFQLALFRNRNRKNLFADRIFDVFDVKRNGVIEFGEFVRSLGVFHPNAPVHEKIKFAFKLYDLRQTGFIEREELKEMVIALLHESELVLSEDMIEVMVDKAFVEADRKNDGKIDLDEWKDFVSLNPSLIKNMTLPYLKDIKGTFPSFVSSCEDEELELQNLTF